MPCLCEDCQLDQQRSCSVGVPLYVAFQDCRMPPGGRRSLRPSTTLARVLSHLSTAQQMMHDLLECGQVDDYQQAALHCEMLHCRQVILDVAACELYLQPA